MAIQFKNYNFDKKQVTALVTDTFTGEFLWIAFAKDTATGKCTLRKVSAHNPNQIYYSIELEVDKIVRLKIKDDAIYLAVEHATIMGYKILTTSPLTSQTEINRPGAILENPVDIGVGASKFFYLFPGEASAQVAKVVEVSSAFTVVETIELQQSGEEINFARSLTVDSNGDIWIGTYTDPAKLVRLYQISGGLYVFSTKLLI